MAPRVSISWPFSWRKSRTSNPNTEPDSDSEPDSSLDPVLLVPGIGGSILNAVSNDGKKKERVWVRLVRADHEFRSKLWSKYNPETGKTESLDPTSHIEVPQDNFGLYSCDSLDPDLKIPLDMVMYYHKMIVEMRKWGYVDGENLFGFGYDFRQSNRLGETMDAFREKLKSIHESTGKKVNVITHSMGGLVMKSFVSLHQEDVSAHVSSWVAIASPFRGAPGFIMDTLLTGVEFLKGWQRELFVAKWSMHQLLVECPSVFELMAEYDFEWEEKPELRIVHTVEEEGEEEGGNQEGAVKIERIKSPERIVCVLEKALANNSVTLGGNTIPLPLSKEIVDWANETRNIWSRAKLPDSVKFYSIYGLGMDTPFHTSYGSENSPIDKLEDILHTEAEFSNVDGDGTVPAESAKGDGFNAIFRIGVPGEHRGLLGDDRVFRLVKYFLNVGEVDSLYDPLTDCVLVPSKEEVEAEMEAGFFKVEEREEEREEVEVEMEVGFINVEEEMEEEEVENEEEEKERKEEIEEIEVEMDSSFLSVEEEMEEKEVKEGREGKDTMIVESDSSIMVMVSDEEVAKKDNKNEVFFVQNRSSVTVETKTIDEKELNGNGDVFAEIVSPVLVKIIQKPKKVNEKVENVNEKTDKVNKKTEYVNEKTESLVLATLVQMGLGNRGFMENPTLKDSFKTKSFKGESFKSSENWKKSDALDLAIQELLASEIKE